MKEELISTALMNTLLMDESDFFRFNPELPPSSSTQKNPTFRTTNNNNLVEDPSIIHAYDQEYGSINFHSEIPSMDSAIGMALLPRQTQVNLDGENDEVSEFSENCLKFISEILLEEDLDDQTASLHDYTVLEATEKSLYDALRDNGHVKDETNVSTSVSLGSYSFSNGSCDSFSEVAKGLANSPGSLSEIVSNDGLACQTLDRSVERCKFCSNCVCSCGYMEASCLNNQKTEVSWRNSHMVDESFRGGDVSRGQKIHTRDDSDWEEGRRNKHFAAYSEEYVQMEQYDDVLLCKEDKDCHDESSAEGSSSNKEDMRKKTRRKKRSGEEGEAIDLRALLIQSAQAVGTFDLRSTNDLLKQIRVHSSQFGNSAERLAHYFANALEARLSGTGWQNCRDSTSKRLSAVEVLQAYRVYVTAIPFRRISYFMANDAIIKMAENATRIHVIDFGIFFGFQWPDLIQRLSRRATGPPLLRITGIDNPEPGFRPAQRVQETGNRLSGYCERFKVPFTYQAIAKNWETVTLEDLNIDKDELVVVNSLYMSRKLLEETVGENNPRDGFLRLIRSLQPDLFIHGIVNGLYNAPFFVTRFREALYHFSSIFDMFEVTMPRESDERMLLESHLYGGDILNAIACEGVERVERPETYKQWQVRIMRAGFSKLPLDYDLLKKVKSHVKREHHKDIVIDEDGYWMLQGWKGRVLYAVSCWRPA